MQVQVKTDNQIVKSAELTRQVEAVVAGALGRFGERITRVEVHLSDENSRQKFGDKDKRCVMEARLAGLQPTTVSHRGATLEQVLDGAADTLLKTLKRKVGRRETLLRRRARTRAEFTAVDPRLEHDVAAGAQEEFETLLRPLLSHLRDHTIRELRILEINGLLPRGQVTADDVLNEVLARAWLRFAGRPRPLSLEMWLVKLVDETLDEMIVPEPETKRSLAQPIDELQVNDLPDVDDQEWWMGLLDEVAPLTFEDAIPSDERTSPAEQLEARELADRVHHLLGELPRLQRQAFVLHVLEAYDLFEVAMLQDRAESEVEADIEDARSRLHERLRDGSRAMGVEG